MLYYLLVKTIGTDAESSALIPYPLSTTNNSQHNMFEPFFIFFLCKIDYPINSKSKFSPNLHMQTAPSKP